PVGAELSEAFGRAAMHGYRRIQIAGAPLSRFPQLVNARLTRMWKRRARSATLVSRSSVLPGTLACNVANIGSDINLGSLGDGQPGFRYVSRTLVRQLMRVGGGFSQLLSVILQLPAW